MGQQARTLARHAAGPRRGVHSQPACTALPPPPPQPPTPKAKLAQATLGLWREPHGASHTYAGVDDGEGRRQQHYYVSAATRATNSDA